MNILINTHSISETFLNEIFVQCWIFVVEWYQLEVPTGTYYTDGILDGYKMGILFLQCNFLTKTFSDGQNFQLIAWKGLDTSDQDINLIISAFSDGAAEMVQPPKATFQRITICSFPLPDRKVGRPSSDPLLVNFCRDRHYQRHSENYFLFWNCHDFSNYTYMYYLCTKLLLVRVSY